GCLCGGGLCGGCGICECFPAGGGLCGGCGICDGLPAGGGLCGGCLCGGGPGGCAWRVFFWGGCVLRTAFVRTPAGRVLGLASSMSKWMKVMPSGSASLCPAS